MRLRFPDGHEERTRLIGIDTPETHPSPKLERDVQRSGQDRATIQALGREATAFTEKLLPRGTRVEVEPDVRSRDRNGRLLAYLWLADGRMVNVELVAGGLCPAAHGAAERAVRAAAARVPAGGAGGGAGVVGASVSRWKGFRPPPTRSSRGPAVNRYSIG